MPNNKGFQNKFWFNNRTLMIVGIFLNTFLEHFRITDSYREDHCQCILNGSIHDCIQLISFYIYRIERDQFYTIFWDQLL